MSDNPATDNAVSPPYIPFKTFKNFIGSLRESGLPGRIDKSVMGKLSGSGQTGVLQAFRYFKLIESDGKPTKALIDLTRKPEAEAKKDYADLIGKHYGFIAAAGVELATTTDKQLEEAFEKAGLSGDTVRKAVGFFVPMAKEAGLQVSNYLKAATRKASGTGQGARRPKRSPASGTPPPVTPPAAPVLPPDPEGHKTYSLDLSADGKRLVRVTAPLNLSTAEVERIKGWMGFQFSIETKRGS